MKETYLSNTENEPNKNETEIPCLEDPKNKNKLVQEPVNLYKQLFLNSMNKYKSPFELKFYEWLAYREYIVVFETFY